MIYPGDNGDHQNGHVRAHSACAFLEHPARSVSDEFEAFGHGKSISDATPASPLVT